MAQARVVATAVLLCGVILSSLAGALFDVGTLTLLGGALLLAAGVTWRLGLSWPAVLTGLLLIILLVPIKRYDLALGLPFQLEPYRIALAGAAALWLFALLGDPAVRLRRTGLDAAVIAVGASTALSIAFNLDRFVEMEATATKALIFFSSYFVLYFLVTSVAHDRKTVDRLLKVLVVAGAIVAVFAIVEPRTGFNPYDWVLGRVPFLVPSSGTSEFLESRGSRAVGPAQHPIALGAALVMLLPLAVYFFQATKRARWAVAALLLAVAGFATLSRTTLVMLAVVGLVFFWLRRAETLRAAPLVLALVVAVHFLVPGALGTMKLLFFPEGGLIAEQSNQWATIDPTSPIACSFTGRAADIGPTLDQVAERPFFGYGFGTRVTVDDPVSGVQANACVLDNQWLGMLLDVGVAGFVAWWWVFLRFVRRAGAAVPRVDDATAWLLAALAATVSAFAAGMFLFDAFSFIQAMLLLFVLLAFGGTVLDAVEERAAERVPSASGLAGLRAVGPRPSA